MQDDRARRHDRRKRRGLLRTILRRSLVLCALLVGLTAAAPYLGGLSIVERVRYEWSDAGEEHWQTVAVEGGIASSAEEYYYDHLPEELHEAYREIYVHVMSGEDSGDFLSQVGVDNFWKVYYAMLADHPEIFWIGTRAQIEESGVSKRVITYDLEVTVPPEERGSMRAALEAAADGCISRIPEGASDYEKIKFVYEYMIDTVEYRSDAADSQNIQSALLNHASVCAGYSKAFQYILNRMGLFCTYITGKIQGGGDHGWNLVRIDGAYYYVDVTWGDPVFLNQGGDDMTINYNYLCCTEEDLFRTHVPDDPSILPSCTSDIYNYYKRNGLYYETFDYDTIYNVLMNSVWAGDASLVMKFGSREAYDAAVYELFTGDMLRDPGSYLMEKNGVTSWNYRYHTDEDFWVITLYW